MIQFKSDLIALLHFEQGVLDPEKEIFIRNRLNNDNEFHRKWLRLKEASSSSQGHGGSVFDPELVAAFVEQTLDDEMAKRFEEEAWKNPELLIEVFSSFHFEQAVEDISVNCSPQLISRLQNLFPGVEAPPVDVSLNQLNGFATEHGQVEKPIAENDTHRFPVGWVIVASVLAASILVMVCGLIWLIQFSMNRNQVVDHHDLENNSPGQSIAVDDSKDSEIDPTPDLEEFDSMFTEEQPEESDHTSDELFQPDGQDSIVKETETVPFEPNKIPLPEKDPATNSNASETRFVIDRQPVKPKWTKIEGVVAVQKNGRAPMRGYDSPEPFELGSKIVTLPGSWLEATIDTLGQFVIDEDSALSITRAETKMIGNSVEPDQPEEMELPIVFELMLERGRAAFKNVAADSEVQLVMGDTPIPVSIVEKDTSLGIEVFNGEMRLFVRKGEINANGVVVRRGQQLLINRDDSLKPERNKDSTRWLDKAQNKMELTKSVRDQLLSCRNLATELQQLSKDASAGDVAAIRAMSLTVNPATAARILANEKTVEHWIPVFEWLIQQPPRTQRGRVAWTALSRTFNDRETVRKIYSWTQLQPNRVPNAMRDEMFSTLNHNRPFYRFAAAYVLVQHYGNPANYSPMENNANRTIKIRQWRQAIHNRSNRR